MRINVSLPCCQYPLIGVLKQYEVIKSTRNCFPKMYTGQQNIIKGSINDYYGTIFDCMHYTNKLWLKTKRSISLTMRHLTTRVPYSQGEPSPYVGANECLISNNPGLNALYFCNYRPAFLELFPPSFQNLQ